MTDVRRFWPDLLAARPDIRDRLLTAYGAPDRCYHDIRHLTEVCERIELLLTADGDLASDADRDVVLLAAWFHDAVYDSVGNNEERSAGLAERILATTELPAAAVTEIARMVRLTSTHDPEPGDAAGAVICDADLGILATDEIRYGEYTADVRREYAHVPDDGFRRGRAAVLRSLIGRPQLFRTRYAREHWETAARENVQRELTALG